MAGNPQIPGSSQVWRLSLSTGLYTLVAQGGADRNGANASNFSFNAGKTNLLMLDAGGNLWIGDDASDAAAAGAGRIWTVPSASLAALTGGNSTAGTNLQAIFNVLRGPWFMGFEGPAGGTLIFTPTFNADGTFTATITSTAVPGITTETGTWTLTPPNRVQSIGNAQGHLALTDSQGVVLFSADFFMLKSGPTRRRTALDHQPGNPDQRSSCKANALKPDLEFSALSGVTWGRRSGCVVCPEPCTGPEPPGIYCHPPPSAL